MQSLHDYIASQISYHLKDRGVVVMYDKWEELRPFFGELAGDRPRDDDDRDRYNRQRYPAGPADGSVVAAGAKSLRSNRGAPHRSCGGGVGGIL